jgi:opacity protein-like surface antigen
MSRVTIMKAAALALAVVACTAVVPASEAAGRGAELTLFNGYYIGSDLYTSVGAVGSGAQIGLSNSYMYGGRIGMDPNPRLGVELAYTRAGSDIEVKNGASGFAPAGDLGRLNLNSYDMDFLFYQDTPSPRARGFFTLGFGWTMTEPDIKPLAGGKTVDSNSLFSWNFGVGSKVDLNDKLALRLEGRWRVTDTAITTSTGVYCDYWGYCYSYSSDWYNSGELTAGLAYKFASR